jgi:hypothetical protein
MMRWLEESEISWKDAFAVKLIERRSKSLRRGSKRYFIIAINRCKPKTRKYCHTIEVTTGE